MIARPYLEWRGRGQPGHYFILWGGMKSFFTSDHFYSL
jgi:hypothetical protein